MADKKKEIEINHYEERVVAFIDILGFSDLVNQSFNSDTNETIIDGFNKIKRTLEVIRESFEIRQIYEEISWDVSLFSDSIIISFPINQRSRVFDILLALIHLTVDLLKDKIVCRGAIVRGFCYHDEKMVFGPAIIEAVRLEKKGTYPRIIVEQHVLQTGVEYHAMQNTREDEYKYISEMIKKTVMASFLSIILLVP